VELREIDRERIGGVAPLIAPYIRNTPVIDLDGTYLKLELLQHAGSFKTRGAFTNLLLRDVPQAGVVAASGGNHGAAVAYAAMRLGMPAKIYVPDISSPMKIERIRRYGAQIVVGGERYADALAASEEWIAQSGALAVHAFDQPETLLGQGTLAMEIAQQIPDVDTILVSVGGGGLIGGIAAWFAGDARIIAVEPEDAPTLALALQAGRPVDAPTGSIAADSLAPRRVGELMFPIAQRYVDRAVLVPDQAIADAQRALWYGANIVAEPGGATAYAALLSGAYRPQPGERVCVVISGGNSAAVTL
jgi:threonine dehydratase